MHLEGNMIYFTRARERERERERERPDGNALKVVFSFD